MINQAATNSPKCVGVIMDGNRRWARQKGLPTLEGHRKGYNTFRDFISWADEAGIEQVIIYAFSTENWNRAAEEVAYLMDIFRSTLDEAVKTAKKFGARIRCAGKLDLLPDDLATRARALPEETKKFGSKELVLALSYGGRQEIIHATQKLIEAGVSSEDVTEETFAQELWTSGVPDPDLIIRTGGESRLSNFLPWQSVYSELFFTDTLWPDFTKREFEEILEAYGTRQRRNGR